MAQAEQYYALCVKWEEGSDPEIALLDIGENELGRILAIAVYTSPAGQVQRRDLQKYTGNIMVQHVSPQELLDAVQRSIPSSVFLDGKQISGSVFAEMLRDMLGTPIRQPRLVRLDDPRDPGDEDDLSER
jgi:hypothetical protein